MAETTLKAVPLRNPVNEDLVATLERCLERAKAGELQGGVFCFTLNTGGISTFIEFSPDRIQELAAVAMLQYRICATLDENAVESD